MYYHQIEKACIFVFSFNFSFEEEFLVRYICRLTVRVNMTSIKYDVKKFNGIKKKKILIYLFFFLRKFTLSS